MRLFAFALAALAAATPAIAGDAEDAYGVVKSFTDGFNTGDIDSSLANCAVSASVIDEFAPFAWSGENACANWANDFDAMARREGITEPVVTLLPAKHVYVEGDHAYVVAPVDYFYKIKGEKTGQTESTMTTALQKENGQWKITQWAWSTGKIAK